jgi:hypothetical protein
MHENRHVFSGARLFWTAAEYLGNTYGLYVVTLHTQRRGKQCWQGTWKSQHAKERILFWVHCIASTTWYGPQMAKFWKKSIKWQGVRVQRKLGFQRGNEQMTGSTNQTVSTPCPSLFFYWLPETCHEVTSNESYKDMSCLLPPRPPNRDHKSIPSLFHNLLSCISGHGYTTVRVFQPLTFCTILTLTRLPFCTVNVQHHFLFLWEKNCRDRPL